ncbi:hypothetical protein IJ425_00150 [bacterium]|nr:hypothetical protein [bacterium]
MAVVINTNVDSIKINNILSGATQRMSDTMQRMSSGLQILSAKDDAAGTVISARMEVQLNGNLIAQKNVQNANALLSTAEGNLDVIEDNIQRIRDLTLQAKNGTYSEEEIQAMQDEVAERIAEVDRINDSAMHSSLRLFGDVADDGKTAAGLAKSGATFQVGPNDGVDNTIKADSSLFKSVEFSAMTGAVNFNLVSIYQQVAGKTVDAGETTYKANSDNLTAEAKKTNTEETEFDQAIRALDLAIDNITARKSIIGSAGNRMDSALDTLTTQYENLSSAKSIITDADIAQEASKYTQESILQQVSTSLLAQANQAPSIALSLV